MPPQTWFNRKVLQGKPFCINFCFIYDIYGWEGKKCLFFFVCTLFSNLLSQKNKITPEWILRKNNFCWHLKPFRNVPSFLKKKRKKKKSQQGQKVEQADKNSFHEVENTYILWIKNFLHRFFKKIYFYIHWNIYMKQCTCNKKLTHQICI